jgi:uncharacterized protein YbjT (DUF2867 family)
MSDMGQSPAHGPVLVTGGTGTLGSHVVRALRQRGCQVRVLSRNGRAGGEGVEYVTGDLVTGAGIQKAVAGAGAIIHCASAKKGDVAATRHLVTAALAQDRPPHLVYISVVGADGMPFGYFKTKVAAEKVVTGSGLPWTLLRATQFYDFILNGAKNMSRLPVLVVPKDFLCQPVDPADVAGRLTELALRRPAGRVPDLGGPEVSTWAEMVRQYLHATGRHRPLLQVPMPGTKAIRAGALLVQDPASQPGTRTWEDFLANRIGRHP